MLFVPDELLAGSVDMLGMNESCGYLVRQQLKTYISGLEAENEVVSKSLGLREDKAFCIPNNNLLQIFVAKEDSNKQEVSNSLGFFLKEWYAPGWKDERDKNGRIEGLAFRRMNATAQVLL